jgi:PAS domain S-box-containing protein
VRIGVGYVNIVPNAKMLTHGFSSQESQAVSQEDNTTPVLLDTAVICFDVDGRCSSCDAAFLELIGYSQQEIIRREFFALFAIAETAKSHGYDGMGRTVLEIVRAQGSHRADGFALTKKGRKFPVSISATLLRGADAKPAAIVAFVEKRDDCDVADVAAETSTGARILTRTIEGTQFILASPVMHKFMGLVERVASHTETVLITGETGSGKELIARTIHESSHRHSRAWVDINCAALPENLVESELFGYEKGAFSGADASKPGLFELADKGTIFLDEIGELQLQTQVKLLRVLDGQPFYRLGGHRKIKVDVRVVAATNRDLEAAVQDGRFRQDLFHRLSQFQLRLPPLRERPEDIVALAEHFLRLKAAGKSFSPQAISALLAHPWPGNIRELRNLVARASMESTGKEVEVSHLTAAFSGEPAARRQTSTLPVSDLESMEEQMIRKALERTGGQRTLAAEQLGISRRTLSRKLKEYNITDTPEDSSAALGLISSEQQKFFRARVQIPVTIRNMRGEEVCVQGVNLSTGGMGLDGLTEPLRYTGLLDVRFVLPESETLFQAKARVMWVGDEGRVGIRFAVIEPALFEKLQQWSNRKMREEGWDFPS